MAVNPMQRKARQSFLLGMLLMLVIAGIVIGILFLQITKLQDEQKKTLAASKSVYVLNHDVKSGETFTIKDLSDETLVTTIDDDELAQLSDFMKTNKETNKQENVVVMSKIDLKAGTIITNSMITASDEKVESSLRVEEFNMLTLPTDVAKNDYVDIRFVLPNGQDYIVVSKKRVIKSSASTIFLKLSEDEILTMSNAIVEAYITDGSMLRAVKYAEPGIQQAATPTYVASAEVIDLINKDVNIEATAMSALSDRYSKTSALRMQINNALQPNMDDAAGRVSEGFNTQITRAQAERDRYLETLGGKGTDF